MKLIPQYHLLKQLNEKMKTKNTIKQVLLNNIPDAKDDFSNEDWFNDLPETFKKEIDFDSCVNFSVFEVDTDEENEIEMDEFIEKGKEKHENDFKWQKGLLPDGTKVYLWKQSWNTGFLAKNEWLKN